MIPDRLYFKLKGSLILTRRALVSALYAIFFQPLLYLLEPFKKIRIGNLRSERLGHLALDTDLFLRDLRLGRAPADARYFFFSGKPVNRQLLEMLKRHLSIVESPWLHDAITDCLPLKKTKFWTPLGQTKSGVDYVRLNEASASLKFTPEEETRGREWLKKFGIGENDWFVCIAARDSAYLDKAAPHSRLYGNRLKSDWAYDNFYRNSDIDSYRMAVEHLVGLGGYVFRMGQHVNEPLDFESPRFIDYAVHHRTDFMDIYLPAKCRFFIGDAFGLISIPWIFDVPVLGVNFVPIGHKPIGRKNLYLPKKVKDKRTGEYVSLGSLIKNKWCHAVFDHNDPRTSPAFNYDYENNSAEDILKATKEMAARLCGTYEPTAEDKALLQKYFALFPSDHWSYNVKTPIGIDFLKENKNLFFENGAFSGQSRTSDNESGATCQGKRP